MNTPIKLPAEDTVFRKKGNKVLEWGAEEFSMMKPHIKNFRNCLDIGAHVGITTLRFAKHFQTVHSFEPVHYDLLVENTKHLDNVTPRRLAISDHEGPIEMYPGTKNSGAGIIPDEYNDHIIRRRYTDDDARYHEVQKITVQCATIDSFKFENVDLIKIDVEGYILPVLNGMKSTLAENEPVVQMEVSMFDNVNKQAHAILTGLGYIKYDVYDQDWFYYKS